MTKDELIALGLSEEQASGVFALHGKALNAKIAELETVTGERDSLKTQLDQQAQAVEDLKNAQTTTEEEKAKLEQLNADFEAYKAQAQADLEATKKANAIALAVRDTGTIDPDILTSLINADAVNLTEDGKADITELVAGIKESKPYLFADQGQPAPAEPTQEPAPAPKFAVGGNPTGDGGGTPNPFQAVIDAYK